MIRLKQALGLLILSPVLVFAVIAWTLIKLFEFAQSMLETPHSQSEAKR